MTPLKRKRDASVLKAAEHTGGAVYLCGNVPLPPKQLRPRSISEPVEIQFYISQSGCRSEIELPCSVCTLQAWADCARGIGADSFKAGSYGDSWQTFSLAVNDAVVNCHSYDCGPLMLWGNERLMMRVAMWLLNKEFVLKKAGRRGSAVE